ncbi:SLC13 family permease [Aliagarivorans taiwanensis]|uniref:SLC13 family permease n=1 Tax=Aliagarivorans taiwanensis TaxID=561966 RepID=UPI0003FDB033|nr:SLC13 family permease [Aliagarivorans taiwanensis]
MDFDVVLVLATFVATIIGLVRFQQYPAHVFGALLLFLLASGLVGEEAMLRSMANHGLVTLVLLMICSLALEKTRLLRVVTAKIIRPDFRLTWLKLYGSVTFLSAILNNTAVVATLLSPIRNNPYHPSKRLLIPLSFAAIFGGTLTLVGTSTNLIVNSMYLETTGESLSFFDFTLTGLVITVVCGGALFLFSKSLPNQGVQEGDFHRYFVDAKVQPESKLIGQTVEQAGLRHLESFFYVEIVRDGRLISPVSPQQLIAEGDRLVFAGDVKKLMQLTQFEGLKLFADQNGLLGSNLREVVVREESVLVRKTLKDMGFRARFDAAVVAIRRSGERVSGKLGDFKLRAGDFLVLAVGDDFDGRQNLDKNFIMLTDVEAESRLTGWRETVAVGGFLAAIAASAVGLMSLLKATTLLLGVLFATRCLTPNEALRRFPLTIWLIVSTSLMLSFALIDTGLIQQLSSQLDGRVGPEQAMLALVVIYFLTYGLTELVTNNAAAALMFPIAYGVAQGMGLNPLTFVMAVAFAASSSFINPFSYQTNLMVFNAGRYKLKDFVKVGLPICLFYSASVLLTLPVIFPF